jgi:drug/metabolite transporter (DMT)-like permease
MANLVPIIPSIQTGSTVHSIDTKGDRILLGIALRLAAMVALALMFALVKLASERGVHVVESLFWRQLAGLPAVLLWLWWSGALASVKTVRPGTHALRMALGLSAMLLNFLAMILLPMAQATTIGFATPIFATVLAALLLAEPTGRYRWAAVIAGFIGVLIAVRPGGDIAFKGSIIALSGAILTAAVTIQMRRMSRTESAGAIVFWFSLCSLLPLGMAMVFFGQSHDIITYYYIAGLSVCGAVAQILLTSALRHAPVAAILTMDYSSLIWSSLLGLFVFGDDLSPNIWIGAAIIIAAGLLIAWREHYLTRLKINKM